MLPSNATAAPVAAASCSFAHAHALAHAHSHATHGLAHALATATITAIATTIALATPTAGCAEATSRCPSAPSPVHRSPSPDRLRRPNPYHSRPSPWLVQKWAEKHRISEILKPPNKKKQKSWMWQWYLLNLFLWHFCDFISSSRNCWGFLRVPGSRQASQANQERASRSIDIRSSSERSIPTWPGSSANFHSSPFNSYFWETNIEKKSICGSISWTVKHLW